MLRMIGVMGTVLYITGGFATGAKELPNNTAAKIEKKED